MIERSAHERVVELLPWFVNGTLGEEETALVDKHVHECMQCYSLLQQERQLHGLLSAAGPNEISSAEHGFERLAPRLDTDAPQAGERTARRWRRAEAFALAAGLAAIAITALVWQSFERVQLTSAEDFETLAEPAAAVSRTIDVIFAPDLPEAEMRLLLRANGAVIVGGPSALGRYTIRVDRTPDDVGLDAIVERLQSDPRVRFVGPSFIGEAP